MKRWLILAFGALLLSACATTPQSRTLISDPHKVTQMRVVYVERSPVPFAARSRGIPLAKGQAEAEARNALALLEKQIQSYFAAGANPEILLGLKIVAIPGKDLKSVVDFFDAANFDGEDLFVVAPTAVDVDCYYACVADISLSLVLYDSELHEKMWMSSTWYRPRSSSADTEKAAKLWDTASRGLRASGLID